MVRIAFLFFGQHASPATPLGRILGALQAIPIPIWVAIIGVLAAILTPLLNHYFTRRRDRAVAERDDRLRSEEHERRAARVRADVLVRLRSHCANLQPLVERGAADADLWQAAHDALARRARDAEVIDALAGSYDGFMHAIHTEAVAINTQRVRNGDTGDRGARDLRASTSANVAGVIAAYVPYVRELGDPASAATFERSAERAR